MQMASQSGDIASLLHLMLDSSQLTEEDYVKKTLGNLRVMYYHYMDMFHVRPYDLEDMVDGALYSDCKTYIQKKEIAKIKAQQSKGK